MPFTFEMDTGNDVLDIDIYNFISPIHSTSLEMSEVSSETDMLLISAPQQTDAAISR